MALKHLWLGIILLILVRSVVATPLDADTMQSRVEIKNNVALDNTGPRYRVDEMTGTLTWFPREGWLQHAESIDMTPTGKRSDDAITFHWDNPRQQETVTVSSIVDTKNNIVPVREKIQFPLESIPADVAPYLDSGEITDENEQIQALAQQLAIGKTDAYEVVYTLADWTTRNVNYSLASVGQPAIQKSSEVLANRYGKCDELTALFISMNRALGIPARFVAGYAYTNSKEFSSPWGGHGWAEVWLPGQGWVPFDVTYGEYGYLDAGHIMLKTAQDAKETSIDYSARGNDFTLRTASLDIDVVPLQTTVGRKEPITITLDVPYRTVGFGSAALIKTTIANKQDYYVSTRLDLAKSTSTDLLSSNYQNVLLKPYETKTIYFLVKIDDNLKSGYVYEFPFKIYSRLGPEASTTIKAMENAPVYDKSAFAELQEAPDMKSGLVVTCDRGNVAYAGGSIMHNCAANVGSLRICDEKNTCSDVGKAFTITTTDAKAGVYTRTYTAISDTDNTKFFVTSRTVTPTKLVVKFGNPDIVTPEQLVNVEMNLSSTGALPKDVDVKLKVNHGVATQHIPDLSRPATLVFVLQGRALRPGENLLDATITYKDEIGTTHTDHASSTITLANASMWDRVDFWLEDTGAWIAGLFGE